MRAPIRDTIPVRPETAQPCATQPSAQQENQEAVFCLLNRIICTRIASLLTPCEHFYLTPPTAVQGLPPRGDNNFVSSYHKSVGMEGYCNGLRGVGASLFPPR